MSRASVAVRPLLAWLLVLGLLWAVAGFAIARAAAPQDFSAVAAVDPRFSAKPGVNLAREELAADRLEETLSRLEGAGAGFARFTLPWDAVEPERGQYAWAEWDRVAESFAGHPSVNAVVVLDRSPAWARTAANADNPMAPAHERSDFGAFARAVAERYRATYTYYQVWHEPNIAPHWGDAPADPAGYLGLLREATAMIRRADPEARIIAAALAPTLETGGANMSDLAFLDQLYRLGGRAWFDYPAIQPYGFNRAPGEALGPDVLGFQRAAAAREVMDRHGDTNTPLWATSFGWNALPRDWPGEPSPWGGVSADAQAAHAAQAYEIAQTEWPLLGPLIWASWCPERPAGDPWRGFSLCADDQTGPAGATWDAIARAAGAPELMPPGAHRTDHPAARYDPGWRVTTAAADPSADGDAVRLAFDGTGLALRVQGGAYWAWLTVSVDGGPANELPKDDAGASYLVLHDPDAAQRLVPVASGLAPGPHTAELIAHGGWGQWALQGFVVSAAGRPPLLPALLLSALAAAATAVWWTAWRRPPVGSAAARTQPVVLVAQAAVSLADRAAALPGAWHWIAAVALVIVYLLAGSDALRLALLMGLGLLFVIRPELSPPLIAVALPFWQRTEPLLRWEFALFELLAWIGLLALLVRRGLNRLGGRQTREDRTADRPRIAVRGAAGVTTGTQRTLDLSVLALLGAGLFATIAAEHQGVAWREFRIVFLFGAAFYWLCTRSGPIGGQRSGIRLIAGLLAGAGLASGIALWQLVSGQGLIDAEGVWRVRALYGSPNNLALLLDRAIPLALALAAFGTGLPYGARRWVSRALFTGVFALALVAAVATFSKGAILLGLPAALVVVLLGGAWRSRQRWPVWVLLVMAIIGVAGLFVLFRTPRFADAFNFQSGTSFFRLKLWQGSLAMALDHPLLGVGPDNFLYSYRTRYVLPSAWQELNLSHPHNIFLDLWTRLGLIGAVIGGVAIATAFGAAWRLFRRGTAEAWPVALGLLGGLVATVAHGLIDNSLFLPDLMGWFIATLALCWLMLAGVEEKA